jgi:hypothetical protein
LVIVALDGGGARIVIGGSGSSLARKRRHGNSLVKGRRRLTIARLMLLVAIPGLGLAFVVADPPSALRLLTIGLLVLVLVIMAPSWRHQAEESV